MSMLIKGMDMPKAGAYTCEIGVVDKNTAVLTLYTPIDEPQRSYKLISLPAEKTGKWTPCTERLPDMGEEVWVTADGATYIATLKERKTTFGDYIQEWWTEDDWIFQFEEITAWQPLYRPQPYKGE